MTYMVVSAQHRLVPSPLSKLTLFDYGPNLVQGILGIKSLAQEIWNEIPQIPKSSCQSVTKTIYSRIRLTSDSSFPFCPKPNQNQGKAVGSLKESSCWVPAAHAVIITIWEAER
jgi:hypothetical protein